MPPPDFVADSEWVTRFVPVRTARVDVSDDRHLIGYAIVFNSLSEDLGGFKERIAPEAVDRTLRSGKNVDALLDHRQETMFILGSTDSGLLRLSKDRYGLKADIRPPDTANARDAITVVKAGLARGMSFRFRVWPDGQEWDEEDGTIVRTITDMEFPEVSIVVNPAYLDTEISARNVACDRRALEAYRFERGWRPSLKFRERLVRAGFR